MRRTRLKRALALALSAVMLISGITPVLAEETWETEQEAATEAVTETVQEETAEEPVETERLPLENQETEHATEAP